MRLSPWDEDNQRLVEAVRPSGWKNPSPHGRYNLVVIGGGTAGLVSAMGAAGLGAKVALVERALLGGDCLVTGCVPSKALLAAAKAGDFEAAMARVRRTRADIAPHDSAARLAGAGVDVYFGDARFVAPDAVTVEGTQLEFRRAVIATGARPAVPPIPGLAESGFLTSESVFSLTELPRRLAIIGGGPIGVELAQAFARLGSQVTLLEQGPRLLPRDEARAAEIVAASLIRDGVDVRTAVRVERVDGATLATSTGSVSADAILVATGRRPNVEELGLDAAGVRVNDRGVVVDAHLRTDNRRVYAAGDVAGMWQFTHAADAMARLVLQNALFFGRRRASELVIPWVTYTDPEVAHVGMPSEGETLASIGVDLEDNDRAIVEGHTEGYAQVLHDSRGRIRSATIVAPNAGDLIATLCLAMSAGLNLSAVSSTVFPYPTTGELVKRLGDAYNRSRLTPSVAHWMARWFRWLR
ncbi:MAG: mercuric reductase [Myxococcales bacterium]|nr:mercuric reductase [Myxococcales bacterium]MCB9579708.1 mercuric reductase [Polyangiaceae bacterium]